MTELTIVRQGPMLSRAEQQRLLEQARDGDSGAMCQLLDDFRVPALALIKRTLTAGNVGLDHADEALSQAMFKFQAKGIHSFGGRAEPRTYFVRIAVSCAIDLVRRTSREGPELEASSVSTPEALLIGQESDAEHERLLAVLRRCVAELEPKYRQAIQLYYLDQAGTCEHCAELAGVSKLAFMQRLTRARRRLAEMVPRRMGAARAA